MGVKNKQTKKPAAKTAKTTTKAPEGVALKLSGPLETLALDLVRRQTAALEHIADTLCALNGGLSRFIPDIAEAVDNVALASLTSALSHATVAYTAAEKSESVTPAPGLDFLVKLVGEVVRRVQETPEDDAETPETTTEPTTDVATAAEIPVDAPAYGDGLGAAPRPE